MNAEDARTMLSRCVRFNTEAPAILYHYTTLEAFVEIVKKRTFWVSHIRYLNDYSELMFTKDLVTRHARLRRLECEHPVVRAFLDPYAGEESPFAEQLDVCVLSFSRMPDLPSQWRGYTTLKDGICAGFESAKLGFPLYEVEYDRAVQEREIAESLDLLCSVIRSASEEGGEILRVCHGYVREFLERKALLFKANAFSEEREWRAVFTARDRREFDFRVKSDLLIPYLEIPLGGHGAAPLREVYFFPSKNPKEKAKSLRMLLAKYGATDCEVKTSGIPLL